MTSFSNELAESEAALLEEFRGRVGVDSAIRDAFAFAREETLPRLGVAPEPNSDVPRVGIAILAGGLATRFGGVPKAAVRLANGSSLLDIKLHSVLDFCNQVSARTPVVVVASPATCGALETLIEPWRRLLPQVHVAVQSTWPRLALHGEWALDERGVPDHAPKGHGEVLRLLAEASEHWPHPPSRWLVSNIDNVFATPSRELLALHVASGAEATVEVVRGRSEDMGGYLAMMGGRLRILEGFQVSADRRPKGQFLFSTNSLVLEAAALDVFQQLPIHPVRKQGRSGEVVVQFERLLGDVGIPCTLNAVVVPREGSESRFIALKTREQFSEYEREVETWLAARLSNTSITAG